MSCGRSECVFVASFEVGSATLSFLVHLLQPYDPAFFVAAQPLVDCMKHFLLPLLIRALRTSWDRGVRDISLVRLSLGLPTVGFCLAEMCGQPGVTPW